MIDPGAVSYFKDHPQYYMYLHPEAPSYSDQIISRDTILKRYPELDFMEPTASLEWSLDELAKRLDRYPNLKVDMAARMGPIFYHSRINRGKVRDFIINTRTGFYMGLILRCMMNRDLTLKRLRPICVKGGLINGSS